MDIAAIIEKEEEAVRDVVRQVQQIREHKEAVNKIMTRIYDKLEEDEAEFLVQILQSRIVSLTKRKVLLNRLFGFFLGSVFMGLLVYAWFLYA